MSKKIFKSENKKMGHFLSAGARDNNPRRFWGPAQYLDDEKHDGARVFRFSE